MQIQFEGFHSTSHGHFFPEGLYALGFVFVLIIGFILGNKHQVKTTLAYKNKRHSEVLEANPLVQEKIAEGYQLLTVVREKGVFTIHYAVYDYPCGEQINEKPLFRVAHLGITPKMGKKFYADNCTSTSAEFRQYIPFESKSDMYKFQKNGTDFLELSLPAFSLSMLIDKKQSYPVKSPFLPFGEQWQWEASFADIFKGTIGQLQEVNQNKTLLYSVKPLVKKGVRPELSYLLVRPDMPKALVAPFVALVLSGTRKASGQGGSGD
jgi:hypothetical protein